LFTFLRGTGSCRNLVKGEKYEKEIMAVSPVMHILRCIFPYLYPLHTPSHFFSADFGPAHYPHGGMDGRFYL
jgi:hypothetical protein